MYLCMKAILKYDERKYLLDNKIEFENKYLNLN